MNGSKYCNQSQGFEEKKLHEAICRALKKSIGEDQAALALIKGNMAYAVTGDENNIDIGAIEKRIKEATAEMEGYMSDYRTTGGDKTRYLECIQQVADEIKALRQQAETVKAKLEKSDVANAEIARLTAWLDNRSATYDEYDDVVIRRVVDCIKASKDGTITVLTKFGTSATETV